MNTGSASVAGACFVGCAGWSLPRGAQERFGPGDSHLARYSTRLDATEINSSFYRPHGRATYARWAASVGSGFRFCIKAPKAVTHERKLIDCDDALDTFIDAVGGLGPNAGCLLVQLPPSLAFDPRVADRFFHALRERWAAGLCAEPRHASWFGADADALLARHRVARVLADPVRHEAGAWPGGWPHLAYLRLHGTPRMYYSAYESSLIAALARRIAAAVRTGIEVWCIFDNTAGNAAADNALDLRRAVDEELA